MSPGGRSDRFPRGSRRLGREAKDSLPFSFLRCVRNHQSPGSSTAVALSSPDFFPMSGKELARPPRACRRQAFEEAGIAKGIEDAGQDLLLRVTGTRDAPPREGAGRARRERSRSRFESLSARRQRPSGSRSTSSGGAVAGSSQAEALQILRPRGSGTALVRSGALSPGERHRRSDRHRHRARRGWVSFGGMFPVGPNPFGAGAPSGAGSRRRACSRAVR